MQRDSQADRQVQSGVVDTGSRGAVTGGGHLNALRDFIIDEFVRLGVDRQNVFTNRGVILPGYYRPSKKWDIVIVDAHRLVAAIELKSHVGPSFGNNFNNRVEEAIGNATDLWQAYKDREFGGVTPWLGYVLVLEDAVGSNSKIIMPKMEFPPDSVFDNTSYMERYKIFCERLQKERLYDAVWFVTTGRGAQGTAGEPGPEISYSAFAAGIAGRVAFINALKRPEPDHFDFGESPEN